MASFNKFNAFVKDLGNGVHNFSSHTCRVMLTNVAPVATNSVKADLTEISATGSYSAGGNSATLISWDNGGTATSTLKLNDPATWTASGATIGPFRYAVLYNDNPTSPADPLIGWWDYGSSVTLAVGETFTVDFDQSNGVFTIS